jgi:5'-nucleotidase
VVTKGDFDACFPYDDPAYLTYWTGAQLKHGLLWMLRDETFSGDHTEFYQISRGFKIEYDQKTHSFLKFEYEGMEVPDDKIFTVGLQEYHLKNLPDSFDLSEAEINENHPMRAVATSCAQILEEMLQKGQHQDAEVEDRIRIHHIKKGGDNEES